ncbi:uncharacterized protein LOC123547736 [Mercenaria mercenaria]|uniref:uncharacterized protein LOC123547736 n=1 Tax=Mercenaria mercenaria TaxID=6596 RepID=UPI00234F8EEF|nr:uncharacterized protein LOC123547736 [Mercenaria mercenaria]
MQSFGVKFTVIFIALISIAYGLNHACWSVDRIADEIIKRADTDADGIITFYEFQVELMHDWDLSNGSCLPYHEFTRNWIEKFHDHHDTAHAFYNSLVISGADHLCILDVASHVSQYDTNPKDGQIEPAELRSFMHDVHPDSHQNGGHGHGHGC